MPYLQKVNVVLKLVGIVVLLVCAGTVLEASPRQSTKAQPMLHCVLLRPVPNGPPKIYRASLPATTNGSHFEIVIPNQDGCRLRFTGELSTKASKNTISGQISYLPKKPSRYNLVASLARIATPIHSKVALSYNKVQHTNSSATLAHSCIKLRDGNIILLYVTASPPSPPWALPQIDQLITR
jgi:hypothetical protein